MLIVQIYWGQLKLFVSQQIPKQKNNVLKSQLVFDFFLSHYHVGKR